MIEPPPNPSYPRNYIKRLLYCQDKDIYQGIFCKFFKNNLVQFLVLFEFYCLLCDN